VLSFGRAVGHDTAETAAVGVERESEGAPPRSTLYMLELILAWYSSATSATLN